MPSPSFTHLFWRTFCLFALLLHCTALPAFSLSTQENTAPLNKHLLGRGRQELFWFGRKISHTKTVIQALGRGGGAHTPQSIRLEQHTQAGDSGNTSPPHLKHCLPVSDTPTTTNFQPIRLKTPCSQSLPQTWKAGRLHHTHGTFFRGGNGKGGSASLYFLHTHRCEHSVWVMGWEKAWAGDRQWHFLPLHRTTFFSSPAPNGLASLCDFEKLSCCCTTHNMVFESAGAEHTRFPPKEAEGGCTHTHMLPPAFPPSISAP